MPLEAGWALLKVRRPEPPAGACCVLLAPDLLLQGVSKSSEELSPKDSLLPVPTLDLQGGAGIRKISLLNFFPVEDLVKYTQIYFTARSKGAPLEGVLLAFL